MEQRGSSYQREVPEEGAIRDYLSVVAGKWWVVAAMFTVAIVAAGFWSLRAPDTYEARTKVLIVARVSERLIAQQSNPQPGDGPAGNMPLGSSLSVETLSSLATANDLLQDIIAALDLRGTGGSWSVESLAAMMRPKVETASRGASLPLLTMTVRGGDQKRVKQIADKWAEVFVRRNAQLFATEAARSYDFLASQSQETQAALRAKQEERLAQQKANPVPSLQSQLDVTTARYKEFLSQLQVNRAALAEAQGRQDYFLKALESLRGKRADKVALQKATPVDQLQNELGVLTSSYQGFLSGLQQKQAALAEARARAQSLISSLAAEPRVLRLKRSIPNDSLFIILAGAASPDKLRALGDLEVTDEELNPAYVSLKAQLDQAQTAAATIAAEVLDLQSRTEELKARMAQLSVRIADIGLKLAEFDDEIAVLGSSGGGPLTGNLTVAASDLARLNPVITVLGSGGGGPLMGNLAAAAFDVARLTLTIADLEKRTAQSDTEIQRLAERIAQGQVELARLDQDISVLTTNFSQLARSLQEARIGKEEQLGSIRIVEAAVEPQVPVGPNKSQNIFLGGLLGIVLGVVAAFAVHYLQIRQPQPARAQRPNAQSQ